MRIHNLTAMILCITVIITKISIEERRASLRIAGCQTKALSRFFTQPNVLKGIGESGAKMEPTKRRLRSYVSNKKEIFRKFKILKHSLQKMLITCPPDLPLPYCLPSTKPASQSVLMIRSSILKTNSFQSFLLICSFKFRTDHPS
jgi:hypothetical protein